MGSYNSFVYDESLMAAGKEGVIVPKCIIKFRPHNNWVGEYGFDWLREGDTNKEKGDNWFKETVGKHYVPDPKNPGKTIVQPNPDSYEGEFKPDLAMYTRLERTYKYFRIIWKNYSDGSPYLYAIPMLTLMEGETAKLKLKVEIEEMPKEITFKFKDENAKDYLSLKEDKLTDIKKGKYVVNDFFEITCDKAFDKEQTLLVYADNEHCGAIKIHPNTAEYQKEIEIVFIGVKTNLNYFEKKIGKPSDLEAVKTKITNSLKQALVKVNIHYDEDLYIDATDYDRNDFYKKNFAVLRKVSTGQNAYFIDKDKKCSKTDRTFLETIQQSYYNPKFDKYKTSEFKKAKFLGFGGNDVYTVFFVNEYCIDSTMTSEVIEVGVGGYAPKIGSSVVICFISKEPEETVTHELLHAMGLTHTFDAIKKEAKYTYKGLSTDNLMDYSNLIDIKKNSLFLWQWKLINKKINYEK